MVARQRATVDHLCGPSRTLGTRFEDDEERAQILWTLAHAGHTFQLQRPECESTLILNFGTQIQL